MLLQNVLDEFAESLNTKDDLLSGNMSIYRNNMISSLVQTLFSTYKMIVKIVGEDFFRQMAKEYIDSYPSASGNLHDYGEYLGDFVAEYPPAFNLPYLSEVALFEWTCHVLQDASDSQPLDIKNLESLSPDKFQELRFSLHPASRLIQFQYPILRIMDLCKGEVEDEINLDEGGVNLLLIRRELEIILVPLSLADYTFLSALGRNEALGEALDHSLIHDPDFKLEEKLPKWIQDKTLVDVF